MILYSIVFAVAGPVEALALLRQAQDKSGSAACAAISLGLPPSCSGLRPSAVLLGLRLAGSGLQPPPLFFVFVFVFVGLRRLIYVPSTNHLRYHYEPCGFAHCVIDASIIALGLASVGLYRFPCGRLFCGSAPQMCLKRCLYTLRVSLHYPHTIRTPFDLTVEPAPARESERAPFPLAYPQPSYTIRMPIGSC